MKQDSTLTRDLTNAQVAASKRRENNRIALEFAVGVVTEDLPKTRRAFDGLIATILDRGGI